MKISRPPLDAVSAYRSTKVGREKSDRTKRKPASPTLEKPIFELSEEAQLRSQAREVAEQAPDIRPDVEQLIAEIQKKLKDGSYLEEISGQAIVESIKAALKEESETLKSESLPSDQLSLDP